MFKNGFFEARKIGLVFNIMGRHHIPEAASRYREWPKIIFLITMPRFTDFPSLCGWSESGLTNLIGSGLNLSLGLARGPDISSAWQKRPLGTRLIAQLFPTRMLGIGYEIGWQTRRHAPGWLSKLIIHQIFSLARGWSKRVTRANIPQLKLGNIRGYSPIFKMRALRKRFEG